MIDRRPTVIDMFSGCGGLSRGFMDAGYEVLLGVDNTDIALKTFKENHGQAEVLHADLFDPLTIIEMKKIIGDKQVDLIIGGPPCQGFSLTGTRDIADERNTLFKSMVEAAKVFEPQAFVLENVPGLATLYKGKAKDEIIESFSQLGYTVNFKVLFAPDYGVPQIRKRIFFVGIKGDNKFEFPEPTHFPHEYVTCSDAISDLQNRENELGEEIDEYINPPLSDYQRLMRSKSKFLHNHVGTRHSDLVKDVISQVPEGGNHKDLPPGVGDSRKFNEAWTRYHSQRPSKTIDTGHRNHFHYEHNRVPTVRENARLQTFTDDFIFCGTKTQQYRQVGNAVPPLLGFHIAKKLESYLKIGQEV
ncbi:DNA (cytosine-5)-methyltransferase 1 [Peribacillus frigoritolerans]|uniref:DNA cytosine methyltransferase n=1 Tax=Peribacillus frigoritolerans TaxID=450367 RepID=UPI0011998C55|nr:DNA cytosine methyltransferase [Peribacillus frigoritolerans]TWE03636.1 DNA (cytosine-5)-methyltransferase 1 [Peribacillus frigoritolerans]